MLEGGLRAEGAPGNGSDAPEGGVERHDLLVIGSGPAGEEGLPPKPKFAAYDGLAALQHLPS